MTDVTAPTPVDRLRAALATNGRTTPDAVAAAQNRARQLGAPRGALTGVPSAEWPAPQQNFDIEDFLRRAPRTSNYLSNVDNAQIAGDPESRDNLASLERQVSGDDTWRRDRDASMTVRLNARLNASVSDVLRRIPGGAGEALGLSIQGLSRAGARIFDNTPAEQFFEQGVEAGRTVSRGGRNVGGNLTARDQQGAGPARPLPQATTNTGFVGDVAGGLGQVASQAAVAIATLGYGTLPALAGQGVGSVDERVEERRRQTGRVGADYTIQEDAALIGGGVVTALSEKLGLDVIMGRLPAPLRARIQTRLGEVLAAGATEGATEIVETVGQNALAIYLLGEDTKLLDGSVEAGGVGAVVGSLANAIIQSAVPGRQHSAFRHAEAEADASTIGNIFENATNSPLRTRSPETFQEFMAQAAEGGPVTDLYISAEALNQSGVDIAALRAAVPSVDQQIEQAAADGGDVRIPVEEFAARGVEVEGADTLVDHMRINPALPSRAEVSALADNQAAELQAQAQQVLADATTDDAFRQSVETVETGFYDQLQAAGRFTKDVNRSYASLVGNFYAVQAKRLGITPEQMAERYPLKITAELPQANRAATLPQEDVVELIHFSDKADLTMSDPTRWGATRATQQAERARKMAGAPGRTYFGRAGVYRGEPAVGIAKRRGFYRAQIAASKLYDFDNDPLGLRDGPAGALNGAQATAYEQAIQAAGFSGYFSDAVLRGAVAVFDPIPLAVAERELAQGPDRLAPVEGAPKSVKVDGVVQKITPFAPAREAAYDYMASRGLRYEPPTAYAKVDVQRATRVADAFDLMDHNPDDPLVRAAYSAMIEETLAQYQFVKATGLEVEFITGDDPYAVSPRLAIQDVVENNHLWVFPTDDGFGGTASADVDVSGNPLLALVDEWVGDRQLRANDVFRIVHDYFGHIKDGFGFRADGEENAWQSHAAMFSPLARRAMTTETRGQNSWVNYGPFGEFNKTASGADTQYAPQKIGLLPSWAETEGFLGGAESGTPLTQSLAQGPALKTDTPEFKAWFGPSKVVDKSGQPLVVYHGTDADFDVFDTTGSASLLSGQGAYFTTDPKIARAYAGRATRGSAGEGGRTVPVYLSVKNPLVIPAGERSFVDRLRATVDSKFRREIERKEWSEAGRQSAYLSPERVALLEAEGYDGVLNEGVNEIIAFRPEQIKSVFNQGTFNPADPRILYQAEEVRPHPAFYSALLRAVAKAPQAKASAAQWKATLAKTPGVKKDEIEWSGLSEWLDLLASDNVPPIYQSYVDSKGNVARESIVTFLENGGVQVEETLLGASADRPEPREAELLERAEMLAEEDAEEFSQNPSYWRARAAEEFADDNGVLETVFDQYKLPGADDTYRELLLTLPRIDGPSIHWDEPNVVAHTRFTTRTDASGARVLFLEEMQSDWHQKGRDEGYQQTRSAEEQAVLDAVYEAARESQINSWDAAVEAAIRTLEQHAARFEGAVVVREATERSLNDLRERRNRNGASAASYAYNILNSHSPNIDAEAEAALAEYSRARLASVEAGRARETSGGVPDAPFRTSWAQLVMKRMIAYAVENNFDKIAWINGNQQNGGQTGGDGSFFYERNLVNSTNDLLKKLGGRVEPVDMRGPVQAVALKAQRGHLAAFEASAADPEGLVNRGLTVEGMQARIERQRQLLTEMKASTARPPNKLGEQNGFVITDQMKAQAADGFALFQQNRGQIALGQDITQTPSVISLLRTADLSTFLHETGHFFLEVTRDMASREDAPPEIKQDFDTLLSWFGVADAAAWQAMPFEDKRKYHEQFARGFEAFLFEGRAPTPALRELFQRFRSWLLNVYRSLTALNVELTPDVRQVMGRMVASQDEIVGANAEYGFTPLAEKPPYMDAASWADYQGAFFAATEEGVDTLSTRAVRDMKWLSNARSKALRRLQNEARLQRRAVKAEVTEEVQAEPVNRARAYLRRGVGPDGEPVPGALKLDRAALEAAYGTEPNAIWRSLRTGGKYGEVQTDGIDPDVAAEMFGYESGDALVRDLVTAEPPQEKIAGLTDQRMLERYGDMADAAGVERAADEAVANDAHIRAIATDYAALATATGQPRALAAAAREHAARIVNSIPLKRLKPAQFFAAMTRAGKAADKAAKAGDLVLAATNRRNQLINLQAAKYALEARAEVDKGLTRFQRIVSANDEALTRSRDMALVNAARAILNLYGFGRVKNDPAAYLDRVKAYDPQLYADIQPFVEGARGGAKPLDLITYEQFQGLRDTVNQLWALSLRTRQIELDGRLVDIKVAQAALSARLDEIGVNVPVGQDQAPTEGQKFSRGLQGARAALRRVESWARGVDAADSGPFRSFIWNPVSTAADRYRIAQADYIRQFLALVEPIKGTLKNKKIAAPEIGYTFSGKAELLHAVLHSGNTSNLSKLLLGRRWGKQTEDGALDTTRWDAFLERAWAEGVLTKEDYDFAQGVWDLLESTKPAAQAAHRAMYGRYFSEVTAQPVQTPWGVYAGGYVPATTDSFMVQDAALRQEQEALEDSNAFMFPAASNGFTKSRVEDYTRELSLDIRLLPMHLDKVLKFTHLGPPVRDVARLLKGKEFSAKLNAFDPVAATDLLLPWLQRSARQVVSEPTKGWGGKHVDAFFRGARARAGMQIMFGNFSNVLQQFTSFSNAATRVRPAKIAAGLWAYTRDPKGTSEAVTGLSDFMKTRANAQVFEMRQSIEQILLDANGLDKLKDFAARHAYFLQQALQNVTDAAVWKGAFDQAVERGDDDLEAIRFADSVIRETQGSLSPEDVSRFETGTPFIRFFTQFYSYFNNQANMLGTEGLVVARTGGVKNGMGRLLYVYMMGYAVPALLGQAIADLMRGGWEDDEDDGYLDEFLNWFFMAQAKFGLAAVPIVGPAANAAIGGFTPASYDDRVSVSPAISMFDASLALPGTYYEAIIEGEGLKGRDVRDTMNMLGLISGLPVGALGRPVAYGYGVATDQIAPTSAADAARGVVTGTASPGSRVQ